MEFAFVEISLNKQSQSNSNEHGADFAFITANNLTMIYFALFIVVVALIAIVTHWLNAKTPCDHSWEKHEHSVKCYKCGKKIPDYISVNDESYTEAA
jgi:hypothetical protein